MVKADGLAAGKGVMIALKKQVYKISNEIFKGKFKSSRKVVIEEFLRKKLLFLAVDKKALYVRNRKIKKSLRVK